MKLDRRLAPLLLGLVWASGCEQGNGNSTDEHIGHAQPAAETAAPVRKEPAGESAAEGPSGAAPGGDPHAQHRAGGGDIAPASPPPGYAPFSMDSETARAVGLRVAPVEERPFVKGIRTTGVVVVDETRTSHVHAKVRGSIESVNVDFVGKSVKKGAALCSIYSQEVLAAQLEFLSVVGQASQSTEPSGSFADAQKQAREQLLAAARRRLALWDVPAAEIERLERTREPQRTFTLRAPRSGIVVAKQALAGMYVDPSVELYLISDIDKLWLLADIYESDVAGIKLGDQAQVSIAGLAAPIPAVVAFLPPTVEEATRTLKVRFNLDNPEGRIRPGAFATVELSLEGARSLGVPEDAVIHAGRQAIVFVVSGERIEPRGVTLGPLVAGFYAVQAGLRAGESVAVGAQFLIDSESRLRATTGQGPSHAGH